MSRSGAPSYVRDLRRQRLATLATLEKPRPGVLQALVGTLARPRIALVDDDPIFCQAMTRASRRQGIDLRTFSSERDLQRLHTADYDVAMIDFDLGTVDGIDVAAHLYAARAGLPAVLVSFSMRQRELHKPWPRNLKGFLSKEIGVQALLGEAVDLAVRTAPVRVAGRR